MTSKEQYKKVYQELKNAVENNFNINEAVKALGKDRDYFYDFIRYNLTTILKKHIINQQDYNNFVSLYNDLKNSKKPVVNVYKEKVENKTYGIIVRDENGLIDHYEFGVNDRHNYLITGSISRELMDKIYSLYTKEGVNLTQRTVSRDILLELDIDFYTFQQILKVFKITKNSINFAPHVLEEHSVDNVLDKTFQLKENLYFKRLEGDKLKKLEEKNLKLLKENADLKNRFKNHLEWLQEIDFSNVEPSIINIPDWDNEKALVVLISDIHVGAMVNSDSLYDNFYNPQEVVRRFTLIEERIANLVNDFGIFDRIMVISLGDELDGFDNKTIRGGHYLPQNLTNKQQFEFYVKLMQEFINTLWSSELATHVDFYACGDSNHAGINGFMANRLLEEYFRLKYPGMIALTFNKFIDFINYGKHTLILSHGKDGTEMQKNYPLFINDVTENKINEYLDYNFDNTIWNQNVIFCKGDLHQSGTSYAKRFTYKSVGSVFGSSSYIQKNFSNTQPCCDFLILDRENKSSVFETRLLLK